MNTTTTIKAFLYVLILFSFLIAVQHLTAQPTITSFAPISCPVGTTVSIIGTNFNTVPANNVVFFGSTRASVITSTSTNLTVIVPTGAIFAPIAVLNTSTALAVLSTRFFNPTFNPSKDSITSTDIEPKIDFTVGAYPVSISIGDIDGDGKSDLAIVNQNSNTVSVLQKTGNNGTVSFATKVDFTTGSLPQSLSIGDIDGDGKIDLAIAVSNAVSVLRNTSSSNSVSFAAKVDFPAGTNPRSIAIVDIDGDGKLDLAIANSGSNTVSVLRNIGSSGIINFATKVDFITGTSPRSIAIGDIDGDEKPDLAVVNNGSNTVSVLRNTGSSSSISFATKVDFTVGTLPQSVSIGDLDGDGKLDLAIANYNSNMVSVLRNTSNSGNISLASKLDFSTGVGSNSVAIGDINGDGKPDLTIANAGSNSVSVLRNTGSNGIINFATKLDFATGSSPRFLAIGDIDGDGKPDLVATNLSSNNVSILHNNPLPQFPPPTITSFTPTNCAVGTTVSITGTGFNTILANNIVFFGATRAIVNAATATILIVTVPIGATFAPITVLNTAYASAAYSTQFFNPIFSPNKGSITNSDFEPKVDFSISTGPFSAAIGDIDGDGKPDLVIANFGTSTNPGNTVSILRNIGNGMVSFSTKVDFTTGANPVSLSIGDIDGDGKPDLAITNYGSNGNGNTVSILRNTGSSGFVNFASKVDFTVGTGSRSVAIGDIDGDGKPDLAIANYSISTVSVLRNTGSSGTISFATKVDFATGSSPRFVAIGDLDGDSKPDLAIANGNSVSVLRKMGNIGTISFANKVDFSIGSSSLSLAIGDIDADGRLDLVVSSFNNLVSVLRNTGSSGTINFATKVDFATGTNPQSLAIGDFDGDGKLDLAIANYGSTGIGSTVSVLQNSCSNGTISFAAKVDFTTSIGPYSLVICDIDGDGKPDLATVNYNSNSISVLRNNPQFSPIIFITSSLTPFTSCAGTVSNQQNFMISGAALTANIIVTAPIGFEVSTTSNSGFGNSINLTQTSGIVNTTTIYIRLTGSPIGSPSGNIVCTSTGAPIQNVAVSSVVNTLSTSTNNLIICPSALPLTWNGKLYNASAIDTVILTNAVGCDSVTILKLTVKPTSSSINNVSICSNELPFTWNGLIFNTAGTQTKISLTNSVGCDSSATLNLTVNPKPNVGFNINTPINQCLLNNNFEFTDTTSMPNITRTWYFNNSINGTTVIANKSFNNTGIFPIKLVVKSDKNCLDSILTNVTVKASPAIGVILGQTNGLQISTPYIYSVTQQLNHSYNWSITNGIIVTGQGTNVLTVQWINTGNGKIIAEITNSLNCNDTSLLNVNIGNVGLNNVENEPKIIIYPNPFNETINITLQNNQILNKSILYDLLGKEILSTNKNELDVKELKPGVYLIQVQDNKGNKYFQKLLKN